MEIKEKVFQRQKGFTLIELLMTLVIAAILLAVAVPSFQDTSLRNNIEAQISELHAAIRLARTEAITRGTTVSLCRSADQINCNTGATWSQGWIVFVDDGATAGSVDAGEEIVKVHEQLSNANSLILTDGAAQNFIQFDGTGGVSNSSPFQTGTFRLCRIGQAVTYARALNISVIGRAYRSRDTNSDGIHEDNGGANLTCI